MVAWVRASIIVNNALVNVVKSNGNIGYVRGSCWMLSVAGSSNGTAR